MLRPRGSAAATARKRGGTPCLGSRHRPRDARAALHRGEDLLRRVDGLRRRAQHAGVRGRHRAARRAAGAEPRRRRARDPLRARRRRRRSTSAACSRARTTSTRTCRRATRSASTRSRSCRAARSRFATKDGEKNVRLTRAHLEEDAGKSLHEDFHGMTGIDLNRAGTPLLEIVSEPDMRSADEAVAYAKALHALVRWIGICDGNMQEGSFRCDANVSVRRAGARSSARARDQEPQQLPLHAGRDRLRSAPADRADRGWRHRRPGDAAVRPRPRRDAVDAQQGRRAGLPLLPRSGPAAARDRRGVDRAGESRSCRSCPRR